MSKRKKDDASAIAAGEYTLADWQLEDRDDYNEFGQLILDSGVGLQTGATQPELNPDGSLADEAQAAEDADIRRVANEYGIDEEVLRNEYRNRADD